MEEKNLIETEETLLPEAELPLATEEASPTEETPAVPTAEQTPAAEETPEADETPAQPEKPQKQKKEKPSKPKKEKKPRSKAARVFWCILRRTLLVILTLAILLVGGLAVLLDTVFNGPSEAARDVLTMTLLEPSATKWIPALFMGEEMVEQIRASANAELPADVTDTNLVTIDKDSMATNTDEWKDHPDGIYIEHIVGETYNAHVMVIRDPSLVYIACANDGNFSYSRPGGRLTDAIESEGAIAGVNGGAFFDDGSGSAEVGTVPQGLLISQGEVKWTSGEPPKGAGGFVGFTEDDILVVAKSMTAAEAEELGIRDGCEFGPVLIMNGEVNQEAYNTNSGYNPRTCIGQRADGAVVFVCIDGRQAGSIGGSYKDCIDILWEYGCVNACNLDGGSSSSMYYRDTYGLYGDAGAVIMVNNQSMLQEKPRRMPSFWMVRSPEEE